MVSFLQRLALPTFTFTLADQAWVNFRPRVLGAAHRSRHTVAQDQRRAAKARARRRAKRHGQA